MAGESQLEQPGWGLTGLAPGAMVAGYRVESRIGAGGMAMVLRARDEALGRTVALKILAPGHAGDAEFRERFIRKSRAVGAVVHPHIIPVYAAGEASGVLYLAMRFVAGGDLRSVLKREGPLPSSRAAFLLSPVASALDAAHAAGLVHRDVKPANILIDTSPGRPDHLYLSDFGLAKGTASTGLTGTGQFLGTLDYCAPEQISGKPARPQTDQYALACVAYTVLTGRLPFARDEPMAVLWAHMHDQPPSLTAARPDLPAAGDAVLARAMAKDPEERYPTCAEFADAVRAALGVDAYTTPSSVYSAAVTSLPPRVAAVPGPAVPAHASTQSGSSQPTLDSPVSVLTVRTILDWTGQFTGTRRPALGPGRRPLAWAPWHVRSGGHRLGRGRRDRGSPGAPIAQQPPGDGPVKPPGDDRVQPPGGDRRRWPIVTAALGLLVLLQMDKSRRIRRFWRYNQGQHYVLTDDGFNSPSSWDTPTGRSTVSIGKHVQPRPCGRTLPVSQLTLSSVLAAV